MKKYSMLLAAAAGLSSAGAMAQTSVVVYGIVDTSLRYVSSDSAAGKSNFRMDNGAISNSRWGLKGTEDLGGGLKAIFRLENGFNGDTGSQSDSSSLFNRHAYVGLSGSFGQFTVGRQQTTFFDLMGDHFDPLTVGNYDMNSWLPAGASLIRSSNMLKYYGTFGGFSAGLGYALGEQAGSMRRGSQISSSLQYTAGALSFGGAAQQTVSALNSDWKDTAYNLSASYAVGAAKLFAGYYRIRDRTGTTTAFFGGSNSEAAAFAGIPGSERKDDGYFVGATFQATPAWALTAAGYYDRSRNISLNRSASDGGPVFLGDGKRYAIVGLAEYALSKRTQIYGTIDYNNARDAAQVELAGRKNIIGAGVGVRHIF
ncbi:MAG: gram-negative porin family protein [Herbaspirillum sp.]|jgi:predicted porin|nr:gram-negative porin family protein [Herbaspirillum sp.]